MPTEPKTAYGWMIWDHDDSRWLTGTFFERRQQADQWVENARAKPSRRSAANYEAFPVTVSPRPGAETLRAAENSHDR
jgi:hypothetical protein